MRLFFNIRPNMISYAVTQKSHSKNFPITYFTLHFLLLVYTLLLLSGILAPEYAKLMVSFWFYVKFQSYLVKWVIVLS